MPCARGYEHPGERHTQGGPRGGPTSKPTRQPRQSTCQPSCPGSWRLAVGVPRARSPDKHSETLTLLPAAPCAPEEQARRRC
jgi:hypothetical protein